MDSKVFLNLLAVFLKLFFTKSCEVSITSESGIELFGFVHTSLISSEIEICFDSCKGDEVCQSINYNLETKLCEFNKDIKRFHPSKVHSKYLTVYMENPLRAKKGSRRELAAHSCKQIQDLGESLGNGEYWIDPAGSGNPLLVYCDMTTESGGGWTLVTQVKLDTATPGSSRTDTSDYRAIANYMDRKTMVTIPGIRDLRRLMGISQLRWRCNKKSIGRTIDIMTTNDSAGHNVLIHFLYDPNLAPPACNSFVRLPDDTSILSANCINWGNTGSATKVNKWGRYSNKGARRIYNNAFLWETKYYFTAVAPNFFCDDFSGNLGTLSIGDVWQVFVR